MIEKVILSGNCTWSMEAMYQCIKGMKKVEPGFYSLEGYEYAFSAQDKVQVVSLEFDNSVISFKEILDVFFIAHNPSLVSWKKEECVFPLHRSGIMVNSKIQEQTALEYLQDIKSDFSEVYTKVIEDKYDSFMEVPSNYHNYYIKYPTDGYCLTIINPKLNKLSEKLEHLLDI